MSEIKVNINNLENGIKDLQKLLVTCMDIDVSAEEKLGGGR